MRNGKQPLKAVISLKERVEVVNSIPPTITTTTTIIIRREEVVEAEVAKER